MKTHHQSLTFTGDKERMDTKSSMLLNREHSCLMLVDVQEKLTPWVRSAKALVDCCKKALDLAQALQITTVISEQYPSGLGQTVEALQGYGSAYSKVHFSCWADETLRQHLISLQKKQIVLIGIETHVCVLQTALDLRGAGYDVFVVVDALSTRHLLDHRYGLKRMKAAGVQLVTFEMVFFEWMHCAGTQDFKMLSKQFLSK